MGVDGFEATAVAGELPSAAEAEIRDSWRRSWRSGVRPDLPLERLDAVDVDQRSRLLRAALPVLDQVAAELGETAYFTVLADSAARIVHRGRISSRTADILDDTGVVLGRRFTEDTTGTNAIATPFELRRGVAVIGGEHFARSLRGYSCYGYPIVHPATRRLEGVLDLAGPAGGENPLFGPFLRQAVRQIESALLADSRDSERRLLDAFNRAVARRGERAVLALGDDGVVLANQQALDHFDALDHERLRELAHGPRWDGKSREVVFETAHGMRLRLTLEPVGGHGNVLIRFTPAYRSHPVVPRRQATARDVLDRELARYRAARLATFIAGEAGTGRTRTAHSLASGTGAEVVTVGGHEPVEGSTWLHRVRSAAASGALVVVEGVELLDDTVVQALGECVAQGIWTAITGPPVDRLGPRHRHLAFRCPGRLELPPLRERRADIPALARAMLAEATSGSARFTPAALACLAELDWPGNLRELDHVVRRVAAKRSTGDIVAGDLPREYRGAPAKARLTPWERSEHDAILAALERNQGNKTRAAEDLGISRGTLYNRIRVLRIRV
ncbi:helix-turn-helix domain-containing protein [Amycolatopsis sp. NPDC006125]|uniref:sigma-54-dependent Fis family transcriptional regulator n=1 Tax=Amycolatopsis sp. NPDC006125 TaxID=3156730 RepID=UPI0033BE8C8C